MDLRYTIGIDGSAASRVLAQLQGGVGGLHGALLQLGAIGLFTKVLKDGFEFNQTMHDGELAVAAIVQQFQGLDAASSKQVAAGAMQKLVDMEPKVAGSLSDIVQGFSSTAAAAAGVGIGVNQNIHLVGLFANALAKLNMPVEQVGQELRSILSGNIGADSQLARTLGITNEMVAAAKDAGNLYEMLVAKIGKLGEAGDNAATRFSSLQSAIQKAEGAFAEGLFQQALDGSVQLTDSLNDNTDSVRELGAAVSDLAAQLVKGIGAATDWGRAIGATAGIYADMLTNGTSYAEAMANAEAALTDAINERADAVKAAASASAEGGQPPAASQGQPLAGGSGKAEKADKIASETLEKQNQLDELKRKAAEDEMTMAERIAALRERVAAAAEYENTVKSIGVADTRVALEVETKRVELQRELSQLEREEAEAAKQAAKAAADKAAQARREVEAHNQSRNNLLGELAILEAQADGDERKEKALRRQLQIENDKQAIMHDQKASEEEALRLATRKADLQDKINKRRDRDSGRDENQGAHIGGVTKSKRGFGGLDEYDRLQKGPTAGLGVKPWASSLDAFKDMQRAGTMQPDSRLLSARGQALSDRLSQSTARPMADSKGSNKEDSNLAELKAIKEELKRIRTA